MIKKRGVFEELHYNAFLDVEYFLRTSALLQSTVKYYVVSDDDKLIGSYGQKYSTSDFRENGEIIAISIERLEQFK